MRLTSLTEPGPSHPSLLHTFSIARCLPRVGVASCLLTLYLVLEVRTKDHSNGGVISHANRIYLCKINGSLDV